MTLALHRLLAAILRTQPHQQQDLPILAVQLLRTAVPDDPRANPPAWSAWRQLLPHVLIATDPHRNLTEAEENVAWLLDRAGLYLLTQGGEPAPARPLFERALDLRRSRLGNDHPDTLESANNLAEDLWALGRYEQASQLAEDTLTRRRVLGAEHPETLRSARVFALTLWTLGKYEQARQLGEDTLTRCRRVLGGDHPDTLRCAHNLVAVLANLGEHNQ